jgi:hypothetical protein
MATENLETLSIEQLQKKRKDASTTIKFFVGIFIIYLFAVFVLFIVKKKFNISLIAILCLLPIFISHKDAVKKIDAELAKRGVGK